MTRLFFSLVIIFFIGCVSIGSGYGLPITAFGQQSIPSKNEATRLYKQGLVLFNDPSKSQETIHVLSQAAVMFSSLGVEDTTTVDIQIKLGICYQDLTKYEEAIKAFKKAKDIHQKLTSNFDDVALDVYVTLGDLYSAIYVYDSASYYYSHAESKLQENRNGKYKQERRLYSSIGALNYAYGNTKLALDYLHKALAIALRTFSQEEEPVIRIQSSIVACLLKLGKTEEAIQKYKLLITYNKSLPLLYNNLGMAYQSVKEYDSAAMCFKKVLELESSDALKIKAYNSLGVTYLKINDFENSLASIEEAIDLNRKVYKSKNVALAFSYMNRGQVYAKQNNLLKALQEYQQALILLHFDFNDTDIYKTPLEIDNLVSALFFFECLRHKAEALEKLYEASQEVNALFSSFTTFKVAIELADKIRKSYGSENTKLFFSNTVYPIYEGAIRVAYTLNAKTKNSKYIEWGFSFADKSKLAVLSDAISDLKFKKLSGISSDLLRKEESLKQQITKLYTQLGEARDSAMMESIRMQLIDAEIEFEKLIKAFESNENYYQLKYKYRTDSVTAIQKSLDKDAAMLSYFTGSEYLYIFALTKETAQFTKIQYSHGYRNALMEAHQALYASKKGALHKETETTSAFSTLFSFLIKPIESSLFQKRTLIVVPHGELNYIPFEALCNKTLGNRYLLNDYSVSYLFAASYLKTVNTQTSGFNSGSVLAMAPFTKTATAEFSELRQSRHELDNINGDRYFDLDATKELFISEVNNYDILHLATHAKTFNDEPLQSFVAFYPVHKSDSMYKLSMSELYNLNMENVKLAIISACEVSNGRLMKGEGIISLSRAFAFGGCKTMITSLWSADDAATAAIMRSVHTYLQRGYNKNDALRKAKLDYLASDVNGRLKAPWYWANFILIGSNEPLYTNYIFYVTVIMLPLTVIGFVMYVAVKRRRRRSQSVTSVDDSVL